MNRKIEMQYRRLFEVINNRPNKIWELSELFKDVNFLLPEHLIIKGGNNLGMLIRNQSEFKIFRCIYNSKRYYIFRKVILEE